MPKPEGNRSTPPWPSGSRFAAWGIAGLVWAASLPIPLYTVPGPRGGTIYVASFYAFIPAVFREPGRVFTEISLLLTILAFGALPVVLHIAASRALGSLLVRGFAVWRQRRGAMPR